MTQFDYIADFPIPLAQLPERLRKLLEPVDLSPQQRVDVTTRYDHDQYGPAREYVHMIMAVVPESEPFVTHLLRETADGVVSYSTPLADEKGCIQNFTPTISTYDYIVGSWGDASFFTFNLAEKVWMALGLTPRCVGNDSQRIIYDDLRLPDFGVAEGEISNEYYWHAKRNINWRMSNEYLRKYLWMRDARGVRVFFYEALLPDDAVLRSLMGGKAQVLLKPAKGWCEVDIREHPAHNGALLIQVWATVAAVSCELCPEQSADGVTWPDVASPMTHARANALIEVMPVLLDDGFLERYEQNASYDTTPVRVYEQWHCSPSYRNQWGFSDCVRVGRNLVRVPMRELYKPKPDREILHARRFARSLRQVTHLDLDEEHIVSKTQRLLDQLLSLGGNLSALAGSVGISRSASDLVHFSRDEVRANGWIKYPELSRLAQVAPLAMSQQAFLARCKSLHEVWQRIPNGFLKLLLEKAGCPRESIRSLGSLKLLEALLNVVAMLNINEEAKDAFLSKSEPTGWNARNSSMARLFLNNDLRIADAHDTVTECLETLQELGFDTANINEGYGRALDFVMDGVIDSFVVINKAITELLER